MSAKKLCVLLGLVAVSAAASAGPIYRIVGADGKVTFSDTPPPAATSDSYRVVGAQGAAPGTTPPPAAPPSTPVVPTPAAPPVKQ